MNLFRDWPLPSPNPAGHRTLPLFGSQVELWWLPERARRRHALPAVVLRDHAPRIIAEEAIWRSDDGLAAITPNRYPFARSAALLWSTSLEREASASLIDRALALVEPHGGTALVNTLGAAATQPRAHIHLVGERLAFLAALPTTAVAAGSLGDGDWGAVDFVQLAPPVPGLVLGVQGPRQDRARAAARLMALRPTSAANLISDGSTTWFIPRRLETPAPHFPRPLGCAEFWGRFCYEDEAAFHSADGRALELAWTAAVLGIG